MDSACTCPTCGAHLDAVPTVRQLPSVSGLTGNPRLIVETLARSYPQTLPKQRLISALYGDRDDGGPLTAEKSITVYAFRANRKLKPLGWEVVGAVGRGNDAWRIRRAGE